MCTLCIFIFDTMRWYFCSMFQTKWRLVSECFSCEWNAMEWICSFYIGFVLWEKAKNISLQLHTLLFWVKAFSIEVENYRAYRISTYVCLYHIVWLSYLAHIKANNNDGRCLLSFHNVIYTCILQGRNLNFRLNALNGTHPVCWVLSILFN